MKKVPTWLVWVCVLPPAWFLLEMPRVIQQWPMVMSGAPADRGHTDPRIFLGLFLLSIAVLVIFSVIRRGEVHPLAGGNRAYFEWGWKLLVLVLLAWMSWSQQKWNFWTEQRLSHADEFEIDQLLKDASTPATR